MTAKVNYKAEVDEFWDALSEYHPDLAELLFEDDLVEIEKRDLDLLRTLPGWNKNPIFVYLENKND